VVVSHRYLLAVQDNTEALIGHRARKSQGRQRY
jgi:hypothetical protein